MSALKRIKEEKTVCFILINYFEKISVPMF